MDKKIISQNILRLREREGWTQAELGEKLYVSDKLVSKWERGESLPDTDNIVKLAGFDQLCAFIILFTVFHYLPPNKWLNRNYPPTRENLIDYFNAHTASCSGYHTHSRFNACSVKVGHLGFGYFLYLLSGDFGNLGFVRCA